MHITVSDEVTNKKTTVCVDRTLQAAQILYSDDWATLNSVVQILAGMKVPKVFVVIPAGMPVPPGFEVAPAMILYVQRLDVRKANGT